MAKAKTNPTQNNDPSKVPSPWLAIEDLFQEWKRGLGSSREAVSEVEDMLRDPDTRSAYSADGEKPLFTLVAEFWRDMAWLEVVPDADCVGDHLEVRRARYVHGLPPFVDGGTFLVLRDHAARWARRLYFPTTAASPPPHGHSVEAEPLRKRGRKESIHWDRIKIEMLRLMDHHGDFDPADSEWNAQARLEEALEQYCQDQSIEEPSDGALRQKLPNWLDEWRSRKSQGISTSS
jgi:hypothetical protein